jgi:hypothetical protein
LKSFFEPSVGSLVQPITVILTLSLIQPVFHFNIAFFILAGLAGSFFPSFLAPFFFLPFFLAGHVL